VQASTTSATNTARARLLEHRLERLRVRERLLVRGVEPRGVRREAVPDRGLQQAARRDVFCEPQEPRRVQRLLLREAGCEACAPRGRELVAAVAQLLRLQARTLRDLSKRRGEMSGIGRSAVRMAFADQLCTPLQFAPLPR
jgi:hypothetical protein